MDRDNLLAAAVKLIELAKDVDSATKYELQEIINQLLWELSK